MEIHELIQSLEIFDKKYKREEIDEALRKRDEITPHLIHLLENVLQNSEKYAARDSKYWGHIYAFMLLGYFGETKAHDVIVNLFSLPNEQPEYLFGDSVTEGLPIVLLRTCGGNVEKIKELILNKEAYDYCRGSALRALSYALIEGYITREEILTFYRELFSVEPTSPDSAFHDLLASCIHDIFPEELMDVIENAYNEELIDPFFISYKDFTDVLMVGKEKCLDNLRRKIERSQIYNIHDSMSTWACFDQPEKKMSKNTPTGLLQNKKKPNPKIKKSKRKQSKASKKANRKKKK
ncbi:DUF1186 domain-containing protein [Desulfogranum japonicum]|uniref:DUF1186 domain-containing protein n=1 Tax=Desulfogranum japonicum TaxID=231447 RepID=UPI00041BC471|nr:DUF1186 domain-containing protein [Desulfogranum japonicum]